MLPRRSKLWPSRSALALVAAMSLAGCRCRDRLMEATACRDVKGAQENSTAKPWSACTSNDQCPDHHGCRAGKESPGTSCCLFADRKCNTEADCCPGQTCTEKKCYDKFLFCTTDQDCGDRGDRYCEVWTDFYCGGEGQAPCAGRCRLKACPAAGCPQGQSCFQGECLADLPCGGSCESGKACVPSANFCQDYTSPTGRPQAACPVSCLPGFLATFQDGRNIWDTCRLPEVACVCAELPPLRSEDLGRFSALAVDPKAEELLVSSYDGQYGDLVVAHYGLDGQLRKQEWLDGFPSGTPKYGPSGPRGGVTDPGDDVGRHTDVAVQGDLAYVSYYDFTRGDLKLALRGGGGSWSTFRVDGQDADLGLYTSLAIDAEGRPAISYFQRGGGPGFDPAGCPAPAPTGEVAFITALKLARATRPDPGPADFTITTVACQSRPAPACHGCTQICAEVGGVPGCYAPGSGCAGCGSSEACVMVGTEAKCATKFKPVLLAELEDGVGLFTSLAFAGNDALIAYMKRTASVPAGEKKPVSDGDLYAVRVSATGAAGPQVLLDSQGDTGFFPDLKLNPSGGGAVSYHDFTTRKLKYYSGNDLVPGLPIEVIDSGAGPAGSGDAAMVGADSVLLFGPAPGQVLALYQDSTHGDLKLASRASGWKVLAPIRTEGAVGFFADAQIHQGKVYASHARLRAKMAPDSSGAPTLTLDNSILIEQFPLP